MRTTPARFYPVGLACMLILLVAAPWVLYPLFLMRVLCYAIFVMAFNLLAGYAGLRLLRPCCLLRNGRLRRGLGRQALGRFGRGGRGDRGTGGRRARRGDRRLAIRRTGIYFAMITLALAQLVYFFCVQAPFTNGENASSRCRAARSLA